MFQTVPELAPPEAEPTESFCFRYRYVPDDSRANAEVMCLGTLFSGLAQAISEVYRPVDREGRSQ